LLQLGASFEVGFYASSKLMAVELKFAFH
jgi:hypothetical protein